MDYPVSQQINKDNDDFSDKKFRQTLNITIINNFLDLKATSSASNYTTLSAFFHHMQNSFKEIPHIFVTPENLPESHEQLPDETGLSKAFTEWLMMWLLRVLSQPCATIIHIECKDLFFSLLQLIKFNNTRNFRHCVLHLFKLLPELNDMIDKFVDEDASSLAIQDYFYSDREITSEFAQELDLVSISITFSSPNECEALQEKITELNSIEVAVASLLTTIIEKVNKFETKFNIMTSTLGKMVQVLIESISCSRFLNACESFQSSVVKGIIFFMDHGEKNNYPLPIDLQQQISNFVVHCFSARTSKVLLQLAVHIIKTEGRNIAFETNPNVQKSVKISERIISDGRIQEISQTWSSFYKQLTDILNTKFFNEVSDMELVCSYIEILLLGYCELCHSKSPQFQEVNRHSNSESELSQKHFLFQIIGSFNAHVKHLLTNYFPYVYEKIIKFYKQVLSVQDLLYLNSDHYNIMCNVLSIPWILENDSFQDLWNQFLPIHFIKNLDITVHRTTSIQSLETLILIPPNISPNWRSYIIAFSLSQDNILSLTAIRKFPFYLYSSLDPLKCLFELNPYFVKCTTVDVLVEFSKFFGCICCVCSGTCSLFRERKSDGFVKILPEIKCTKCVKLQTIKDKNQSLPSPFLDCLGDLMIHILNHTSEYVRRESTESIVPYFNHYKITENILSAALQHLIDSDPFVRTKFSEIIGLALKPFFNMQQDYNWKQKLEEVLIVKLQAALLSSKMSGNVPFQKSVIYSIGEIGKISDGGLLLITIISLLESYMTSIPSVKVVAFSKLKEIAESKQLRMQDLLKAYKDAICKFLAEFLLTKNLEDINQVLLIFEEIRTVFGYSDVKPFINQNQHSILPYLITRETQQSSMLIGTLASVLHIDKREILINNFPFIFSHFVRHCDKAELEKALIFIQHETSLELGSLLRCNYQPVHNELLLHLSTHYHQVFSGLAILAVKSGNVDGNNSMITHSEEMANYLQPKLLGFLVFFDAQMLKSSLEDKKLALESLIAIMKIMGSRAITAVRFKLMATLRLTLRFKEGDFPKICCKAWSTFISSIEVTCLGPLLNQIIVALLPLLELEPVAIAEIFNFLIIEKRSYLSDFYHDLYFVPDTPELRQINAVLKDYNESPSSMADFYSLLCHSLKGISHENLEVRLHALGKLKQVLQSNQKAIHDHLHARESVDNLLSHLVAALIGGCRESDSRIKTALGDCFGELGAIDPGRLDMKSARSKETLANFYSSIDDEDFAFALIQALVHSFLAAEQSGIQGPTGYEGAFRKACEVTMRVMRSRTDALMSVLRPFVHDPLVEWSRKPSKVQHDTGEITNEQGLTHVKDIELRLNGIIKNKHKQQGLPLSIEGQVNHLIQEAVDIKNLSQMYIGWAAYM
ncbi:hypothetical protein CDAR_97931 [Caerostris darwini]|uniref:FATC domain-containing protein n=1 Tax=Caerostris darwini TaxID=1538125 RepID=A0AAV4SQN0_9ARAC|nr:hypothetical protein CDAR_97931 [Caerostris darwini]